MTSVTMKTEKLSSNSKLKSEYLARDEFQAIAINTSRYVITFGRGLDPLFIAGMSLPFRWKYLGCA